MRKIIIPIIIINYIYVTRMHCYKVKTLRYSL